jgi:cytidyltransferase-like protein
MFDAAGGGRVGDHAVYPGTFDPITPGHLDIIDRARHLFALVTVLVAVNGDKQHEYQLAAMNQAMGVTTLLLPAKPDLAAVSTSVTRGPGQPPASPGRSMRAGI